MQILKQVLDDCRALARGEAAEVPIIAGLGGLRIIHDPIRIAQDANNSNAYLTNRVEGLLLQPGRKPPFEVEKGVMCQLVLLGFYPNSDLVEGAAT